MNVVDIDAAGAYSQTDVYRCTLVQDDTGDHSSYLVDVFRVRGGKDHVLSLHGAEGEFALTELTLPAPVIEGTLAGRDVSQGQANEGKDVWLTDFARMTVLRSRERCLSSRECGEYDVSGFLHMDDHDYHS